MENLELLQKILRSSMRYEFDGSVLILTHYYTGEEVRLDLSRLNEDMFEELSIDADEEY